MSKKIILILLIIISSFCLINTVSAADNETVISDDFKQESLQNSIDENIVNEENENVLEHDTEYPWVEFHKPDPNARVSGIVDIDLNVDSHSELKYANVTIENVNTRQTVFKAQDTNPSDGWGVLWDTSNVPNGKYYITAYVINVLDLSDEYSIIVTLNNQEKNTHITAENSFGVVGQSTTVVAYLYDGNSNILANKNLTFTIDGKTTSSKTGSDGAAMIQFTPEEVKNYNILVKFNGDNLYSSSQTTMILKAQSNSTATVITINNITGNTKQNITLKANLKAPGFIENSTNKKIDFYINNKKVGSALTNAQGDAEFTYNISETGGRYIYSAEYANSENENFKAFSTLYVPQSELYITMVSNKSNVKVGDKFKITYSLFNLGPDNSTNVILTYNVVDSLKFISHTVSIGAASYNSSSKEFKWTIGQMPLGNQTLDIIFESVSVARNNLTVQLTTDTYDESVANGAPTRYLTVKSYAKLTANDVVKFYSGPEKYIVYVYGDDGKLVGSGQSVKITVGKTVYNLKTNKNGFVEVPLKFKSGKYTAQVNYKGMSISNRINIKPTLITKNLSKKKSKVIKFTAKVLNNKGKALKGKKITFKLKNKKYKVKTNKKGIATLKLKKLKKGNYKITTTYGKITNKNTIKIK